ncbi:hypothetical protein CBR_g84857 [Chara braunii]|uniref:Uncharacterized protein n=1 Tax=Chara braunii TaxID=69332 RepID=A0A388KB64_CHABU|nr:hypothetical protein CBR_g84857 [Chara braunii]|eukprot:GBG67193.1 hypothetical protein CBR_g84857 [Chara braunii]
MGGDGGDDGERASGKRPTKEDGGTTSKKARRPDGLTIREGQAVGGGDSTDLGAAAAREPSGKSKRKVAAEEGDGQKKPRRRKTAEAASRGERPDREECDEAAAFWLEYKRNDGGEIVEKELPVQLLIDPRKVRDIPSWERYYNHRSLTHETVDDIKAAMLSQFREKRGKIRTKNPLVLAPIYKSVMRRPEKADKVHKDVFKPEDKNKYCYYPVSLNENTGHKMSKQRSQKAAFLDMREAWEKEGRPMAIQGNPSGKEAEKRKFFEFQKLILGKSPNESNWALAEKDLSLADKEYVAAVGNALRQWMPLVTAGDDVFRKAMEFYAKWARGECLADMTDVEKRSILDDIIALRGVFVQSVGGHLKRRHKPGIKDMVATRKVDCVMLRMFHYILFLETEEDERVWRHGSPFFQTEGKLLEEFRPQGLTKQVWVEMRKHFQGAVEYVNICKRTLPHEKESIDDVKRLYDDDRFPKSFKKSVRSILRRTEEEVRDTIKVSRDVRHIKWSDLNRVTSLIPFAFPPSQAHSHVTAIREVVRHYVCNLYVLDLCDPTLLTDWREDDFANLQGLLQTLSPTQWALVIFFPSRWELSFLKGMARLSVHHVWTGKWVRNAQKQDTIREGNMLVEECDRLYVIFNGEKLEDNTYAVYLSSSPTKGPSPAKHTVAARAKPVCSSDPSGQAVACFNVAEEERFSRSMWEDGGVTSSPGPAYGEMECNPSRLLGLLENFYKSGQTVFFFGKAHASVVWGLLRTGRNVVALKKEARMINYLYEFVKTRVADTRNACEFARTTGERNWDPKRDMYWKLSGNKRTDVGDEEEGGPRRYSTSPAGLKRVFRGEPVDDQSSDDGEEERDYDHEPCDRLPVDHDTWQNNRLYSFGKHHRFTAEDAWGHNVVWHPRIFQPAVRNGIWVMAIKEADGKWSGLKRLGAGAFKRKARTALVEHSSLMNPERNDPDVDAYAQQKLHELYANNMLEFRAPFYALETAPSRGIDWRMPQPPPAGQHPGAGGGGDEGEGGGGGGDGSQFAAKGTGETSSVEKAFDGKGSGGKGSGGKGSGRKGSGGKRRTSGSPSIWKLTPTA